ncbi:MAG: hypothetical protein GYB31_09695 [Bacteroidetes bacterium]|nr:hypothetical protein [Bacteroidota bacterium]
MPESKNAFFIPLQLEAKVVDTQSAWQDWAGQLADFSLLPHYAKGENCALPRLRPNISDDLVSKPFQPTNDPLESGIHLHWTLPKEFRRAYIRDTEAGSGEPHYQAVPNRWLIEGRVFKSGEPAKYKNEVIQTRRWLLESDALSTRKVRGSCAFPYPAKGHASAGKPDYRYLGRLYDYEEWKEGEGDSDIVYLDELNAMGYGEILFSGYYPECRNVFGIHDNLEYRNKSGTEVKFREFATNDSYEFRYRVIGWYSKPYQDPMERSRFKVWRKKWNDTMESDLRFSGIESSCREIRLDPPDELFFPHLSIHPGEQREKLLNWMVFRLEETVKISTKDDAATKVNVRVTDALTGNQLNYFEIILEDKRGNTARARVSGGEYQIDLAGNPGLIHFRSEGYLSQKHQIPFENGQMDVQLMPINNKLVGKSLLIGHITNVKWKSFKGDNEIEAADSVGLVLANTPGQALAALLADQSQNKKNMETMLDALQLGLFNETDKLDFPARLERGLHQSGFEAVPGERRWHIRREREEGPPDEKLPEVEKDWSDHLHRLNALQTALDKEAFKIRDRQNQLYADWYKYMIAEYDFSLDEITTESHVNQIRDYIARQVQELEKRLAEQAGREKDIKNAATGLETKLNEWNLRFNYRKVHFSLELQPGTRYWQPTEPVLLFDGLPAQAVRPSEHLTPVLFVGNLLDDLSEGGFIGDLVSSWLDENVFALEDMVPVSEEKTESEESEMKKEKVIKSKEAELEKAKSALQKAMERLNTTTVQVDLASKNFSRAETLLKRQLISAQEVDRARWELKSAKAEKQKAEAATVAAEKKEETILRELKEAEKIEREVVQDESDTRRFPGFRNSNFLAPVNAEKSAWQPVYMDWEVEVFPYTKPTDVEANQKDWPGDAIVAHYNLPDNGPDLQLQPAPAENEKTKREKPEAEAYAAAQRKDSFEEWAGSDPYSAEIGGKRIQNIQGRTFLTGGAAVPLIEQLERQLEHLDEQDLNRDVCTSLIKELKERNLLSQRMAGFNEVMLMRKPILQLPVTDPLARTEILSDFTKRVRAVVGERNGTSPLPSNLFLPLREGPFQIRKVRLVDRWGEGRVYQFGQNASANRVIISEALRVPERVSPRTSNMAYLPPRLVQPARINFRWLATDHASADAGTHANNSPICGYLVPNFLDSSIHVFNAAGEGLLVIARSCQYVVQRPFPGKQEVASPADEILANLVRSLTGETRRLKKLGMLEAMLAAARESTGANLPENYAQFDGLALLMGRPLALVRAKLNLELRGEAAVNQSWNARETEYFGKEKHVHPTLDFDKLRFAVRLGEKHRANDGFFAYFIHKGKNLVQEVYSPYARPNTSDLASADMTAEAYWRKQSNLKKWLEGEEEREAYRKTEKKDLTARISAILERIKTLDPSFNPDIPNGRVKPELTTDEEEELELLLANWEEMTERQGGLEEELEIIAARILAFQKDIKALELDYGLKLDGLGLYKPHNDLLTLSAEEDELQLGILMDPRSPVHLTTGIFPEKRVDIPSDLFADALNNIQMAFLTTPVISPEPVWQAPEADSGELVQQPFLLTAPFQPGYEWSWLQPGATENDNKHFPADQIQEPRTGYFQPAGPQIIFDGWMKLQPTATETSSTYDKTARDE